MSSNYTNKIVPDEQNKSKYKQNRSKYDKNSTREQNSPMNKIVPVQTFSSRDLHRQTRPFLSLSSPMLTSNLGSSPVCSALAISMASRCLMSHDRGFEYPGMTKGVYCHDHKSTHCAGCKQLTCTVLATPSSSLLWVKSLRLN